MKQHIERTASELELEVAQLEKELSYYKMVASRHDRAIKFCNELLMDRMEIAQQLTQCGFRLNPDKTIVSLDNT